MSFKTKQLEKIYNSNLKKSYSFLLIFFFNLSFDFESLFAASAFYLEKRFLK